MTPDPRRAPTTEPASKKVLTVCLAEVPTDVLVWLVDHWPATHSQLAAAVVPPDTEHGQAKIASALLLLTQMGYIWHDAGMVFRPTLDGIGAVQRAREVTE